MARVLRMPEIAANTTEAVIQGWPVSEQTSFAAGDAIVTVETEKAVVDVEAESDGLLLKTLFPEGSAVEVGAPIALIGEPGEQVGDIEGLLAQLGVSAPSGPVVMPERREVPDSAPASDVIRIFASPLARRLARELGIPVDDIRGTGPGGRIVRRDVEAAASTLSAATVASPPAVVSVAGPAAGPASAALATPNHAPTAPDSSYVDHPHSRMRSAIAARLTASKQSTPHFYLRATCRVDRLLELRAELNAASPVRISVNDLVIKAAARAHVLVPAMNVVWTPDAIRSFTSVDISVAVATERGLLTPVLRSVERMSVSALSAQVQEYASRAKSGRLQQDEIEGGTLSITNLGMFGIEEFAAIINPPHSAILAVGAVKQEPVVVDGAVVVGSLMRVTLSVDHRPVDGVVAAEWMRAFMSAIENPLSMLV